MHYHEILKEMITNPSPRVAVLRLTEKSAPCYVTIVRPTPDTMQFVQFFNGVSYSHLSSAEMISDKWEWA